MNIGERAEITRSFSAEDVDAYCALGGARPMNGAVPEVLVGALFTYLLGVELPGPGANYLKQHTDFLGEPRLGELLSARVEITRLRPDKHLVDLETTCRGEDGHLIATGRALIFVGDRHGQG